MSVTAPDEANLANVFEERAEYLSRTDLKQWTQISENDRRILAKLKGPGAKLLTGPRGSGKSTLLRAAYFDLVDGSDVLPVYVNYAKSLALEPLFHRHANALQMFRQWVLMKVVVGVLEAVSEVGARPPIELVELAEEADRYVEALAGGSEPGPLSSPLSPTLLVRNLEMVEVDRAKARGSPA
jgi:hypothetical protein